MANNRHQRSAHTKPALLTIQRVKSNIISKRLKRMLGKRDRDRVFDFLCVGVQKGGTTWLWQNCREHPEVRVPLVKEVQYFSHKHLGVYYPGLAKKHATGARRAAEGMRAKGRPDLGTIYDEIADGCEEPSEEWYRKVFSVFPSHRVAGEFSPDYFCVGHRGVSDIRAMNRDARIIVFIRDPQRRIISSLNMALRNNASKDQRKTIKRPLFLERADYRKHVPVWDEFFGDQILYVPFGEIHTAPLETMRAIEDHLGIGHFDGYKNLGERRNSWSGKFEIDTDVLDGLRDHIQDQRCYLEARFGGEFCSRI